MVGNRTEIRRRRISELFLMARVLVLVKKILSEISHLSDRCFALIARNIVVLFGTRREDCHE